MGACRVPTKLPCAHPRLPRRHASLPSTSVHALREALHPPGHAAVLGGTHATPTGRAHAPTAPAVVAAACNRTASTTHTYTHKLRKRADDTALFSMAQLLSCSH